MLNALTQILAFQLAGEMSARALGLPVPGPVIGMALLFIYLLMRKSIPEDISKVGSTLLSHLSLLFVPAGVGVMLHFHLLASEWPQILFVLVITTMLTIAVTAVVMSLINRWMGNAPAASDEGGASDG